MNFQANEIGWLCEEQNCSFFFGNRDSHFENLRRYFPTFKFARLHQVHGDSILESKTELLEAPQADAHFTKIPGLALIAITADCVPILIFDPKEKTLAAVHAGWRGVALKILPKTIQKLQALGSKPENLKIAFGPHIQFESFEVGTDVKTKILSSISKVEAHHFKDLGKDKSKVNLAAVLCSQLLEISPQLAPGFMSKEDSFSNLELHSFRRDSKSAGRQLSYVALKT